MLFRSWPKPADYDESHYELLLRNFEAGDARAPWHPVWMPNRKTDTNNNGAFSTDYIGGNYDYPDAELADIAARVERLAPETFTTHVIMNNNMEDQGQRNAATLTRILEARRQARVPRLVQAPTTALEPEQSESEEAVAAAEWLF